MKIQYLNNIFWKLRQPLTKQPELIGDPVSDLFIWRSSTEWETFYELIDIPAIFEDRFSPTYVNLIFFNQYGDFIFEKQIELHKNYRKTLDISSIIGQSYGDIGTFAIFHAKVPECISSLGSYLVDRGYVSYCYRNAAMRTYVHGNLDAISKGKENKLRMLGGCGYFYREYFLQHKIEPHISSELCIVNATSKEQNFMYKLVSVPFGKIIEVNRFKITPRSVKLVKVCYDDNVAARFLIKSKIIMARPLVFRFQNQSLDVFHG